MAKEWSEHEVQRRGVQLLREARVKFFAVPNGGLRSKATALKLWAEGAQAGVPDLIIIDPTSTGKVGAALELKRRVGGAVSAQQDAWLQSFRDRGWEARVVKGYEELRETLVELGYLKPPAADDGNTAPSPTVAELGRTSLAPSGPTAVARKVPKRGKGGAA